MVLDPKHFDDIDNFDDFDDKIEACEGDLNESGPNHPLAWRRVIIERALHNVKKAMEQKADINTSYKKGELVFDGEAHKFARVLESQPGLLSMNLVAGGKIVRKKINELDFVRENHHCLTLPELAKNLAISEHEVVALLNKLESNHKAKPSTQAPAKKLAKGIEIKKVKVFINTKHKGHKKIKGSITKKKTPIKTVSKKLAKSNNPISFTKLLPKGATTDPVMDPNGYIQQNFLLMNNRELSFATGLSEHTIRRKLGEWNLKRKNFINKA